MKSHIRAAVYMTLCLAATFSAVAQQLHYYEFVTRCGHGEWRDTSFIAATADSVRIAELQAELTKPLEQRRFINGAIGYGHGGFNHNAGHWFKWHILSGQWQLVENAIEVCDGCPYSDLDMHTDYWIETVRYFCPWSGQPARELSQPTAIDEENDNDNGDEGVSLSPSLSPNPAQDVVYVRGMESAITHVFLYTSSGWEIGQRVVAPDGSIDISNLASGIYLLRIPSSSSKHQGYYQTILMLLP